MVQLQDRRYYVIVEEEMIKFPKKILSEMFLDISKPIYLLKFPNSEDHLIVVNSEKEENKISFPVDKQHIFCLITKNYSFPIGKFNFSTIEENSYKGIIIHFKEKY